MRILVLQHLDVEHPGVFGEFWRAAGHEMHVVELDQGDQIPALEGFDMLTVMGGPMNVWQEDKHPWLVTEKAAIRRWVRELERPYLGVCLGHQLLGASLGGRVAPMKQPEVGIMEVGLTPAGRNDPLLDGLDSTIKALQWHGAEVADLPEGAVVLAANAACPVQMMRIGPRAYGFQFHMEVNEETIRVWKDVPQYKASLERSLGLEGAAQLEAALPNHLPEFRRTAERLNANFMKVTAT